VWLPRRRKATECWSGQAPLGSPVILHAHHPDRLHRVLRGMACRRQSGDATLASDKSPFPSLTCSERFSPKNGVLSGLATIRPTGLLRMSMSDLAIWHSLNSDEKVASENAVAGWLSRACFKNDYRLTWAQGLYIGYSASPVLARYRRAESGVNSWRKAEGCVNFSIS
jgi:hypothetical protein